MTCDFVSLVTAAAAAAATVFERVIATTGAKATEARIRTNNQISVRTSESAAAAASSSAER
jgi:hypothetical protein